MNESVAIAKEADAKKAFSPARSDKSVHRVRHEPERQLGSLRSVVDDIRRDGGRYLSGNCLSGLNRIMARS